MDDSIIFIVEGFEKSHDATIEVLLLLLWRLLFVVWQWKYTKNILLMINTRIDNQTVLCSIRDDDDEGVVAAMSTDGVIVIAVLVPIWFFVAMVVWFVLGGPTKITISVLYGWMDGRLPTLLYQCSDYENKRYRAGGCCWMNRKNNIVAVWDWFAVIVTRIDPSCTSKNIKY